MREEIFRKKSIERVNSPEQLNEYIRVANPGVWLVLGAVVVLLAGALIWSIFGRIDTTVVVPVEVRGGAVTGYIPADSQYRVASGMKVLIGDIEGTVRCVDDKPAHMGSDTDPYIYYLGGFSQGDFCYRIDIDLSGIPEGIYEAKITVDSVLPVSFVIQ